MSNTVLVTLARKWVEQNRRVKELTAKVVSLEIERNKAQQLFEETSTSLQGRVGPNVQRKLIEVDRQTNEAILIDYHHGISLISIERER